MFMISSYPEMLVIYKDHYILEKRIFTSTKTEYVTNSRMMWIVFVVAGTVYCNDPWNVCNTTLSTLWQYIEAQSTSR